jgi:hypothetical protein
MTLSPYVLMMVSAVSSLSAQNGAGGPRAEIADASARITVPLPLLRRQDDSLAYLVSWSHPDEPPAWHRVGVIVKLGTSGDEATADPTPFEIVPAGSIDAITLLPDSGIQARVDGSTVVLEIQGSTILNTLQGWRPDSLYFETPPWGFQTAFRTWLRPTYEH